ncbi:MAG: RHS repeat-associated core domain-containing protein, partial [Planctomycetaceae bacterium]
FYRARWYDPRAGRFLSEDPLGFAAGDVNLSRYVGNGATLWVDPSGMENKAPRGGLAANPVDTGTIHVDDTIVPEVGQSLLIDYRPANEEYVHHMRVYMEYWPFERLWNWCWGIKNIDDCLGIVTYDIRDELGKQEADQVARKLRILAGCGKLKAHVEGAVEVSRIGVQVATPLLDDMVDLIEFAYAPNLPNGAKVVIPAGFGVAGIVGKRIGKANGVIDDHKLPNGLLGPTSKRLISSDLVARLQAKLGAYPKVVDPRTGRNIGFPTGIVGRVDSTLRVSWDSKLDRAAFIAEWYRRGYPTPPGGWPNYDIHHIHPREFGGTNDFWNLVPVERETHQELFNEFWREFICL